MPFLHHHSACLECDSYTQHYGLAIALNEDGIMSSMNHLADLAAGLIRHMSYDDFHHQIRSYERKLDEAWKANDVLQVEIKDLCKKLGEAPHSSIASVPAPPPILSDEQFARDLEHARIASLGSEPHNNQPSIGTSSSMRGVPPPNTYTSFSLRGRAQNLPVLLWREDDITPGDLYADVPMTVDKPIIQGTMFPNFDRTVYPYRVLCLGQGNDSVRSVLFMRINDNLYAYSDEMISKVISNMNKGVPPPVPTHKRSVGQAIQWERDMMGPIALYNTMEEIHKLYATAYNEPENKAPCIRKAQDLVTYINLWKRCRLEMNEVMDLMLKEWRPPVWASQKSCQKREALRDKERVSRAQTKEGGPSRSGTYQNQSDSFDESSELSRMFPRALGFSPCPNDDEVEGQYRALLEWAEVAPANGTPVPWEGEFTHSATLADVAAYLVANGVTYHDADDALKWAWRAGNEYVARIISNGGDKDPNTKAIVDQMRATLNELLPMGEHHSLEWIDLQAHVLGVLPKNIAPYKACPIEERDLFALEEFAKLAALYDLSHQARGEGSNAGGAVLIPASTLEEGEMEDDSRPM
ncbi:hypothetical protein EDC04DRAFT_2611129 [Pisolithus marmoratus]|nr:hypothetical protein EDC04DRAFT_2611129 [Pisolithus marmoratus]